MPQFWPGTRHTELHTHTHTYMLFAHTHRDTTNAIHGTIELHMTDASACMQAASTSTVTALSPGVTCFVVVINKLIELCFRGKNPQMPVGADNTGCAVLTAKK